MVDASFEFLVEISFPSIDLRWVLGILEGTRRTNRPCDYCSPNRARFQARWVLIAFDYPIGVENFVFFTKRSSSSCHTRARELNRTHARWFEWYDSRSCVILNAWCELES